MDWQLTGKESVTVSHKIENIKSEELNDSFLRKWTETTDVKDSLDIKNTSEKKSIKAGLKVTDKESDEISTRRVEDKNYNESKNYKRIAACKIDDLVKRLCQDVPVSEKAANMCKFRCPKCSKDFPSWTLIRQHCLAKSSCTTEIEYLKVGSFITKVVCHICKVCSAPLLCEGIFIRRHLRLKHQTQLRKYAKMFGLDQSKTVSEGAFSDNVIGNLCVYQCQDCEGRFNNWFTLNGHQKASSCKVIAYGRRLKLMITRAYHKCKLCNKTLYCERHKLHNHLKQAHNITMQEYCKSTGCVIKDSENVVLLKTLKLSSEIDNLCTFVCSACKKVYYNLKSFHYHREKCKDKQTSAISWLSCMVKGMSYKCKICSKLLICDRYTIYNHMRTQHKQLSDNKDHKLKRQKYQELCEALMRNTPVSKKIHEQLTVPISKLSVSEMNSTIGNLCTFSCPNCSRTKLFTSWRGLEYHLSKYHNKTLTYSPSLVLTARYHSCLICPTAVLSDRKILKRHLRNRHKMQIAKYEAIFLKNGGRTIPPFRVWSRTKRSSNEEETVSEQL